MRKLTTLILLTGSLIAAGGTRASAQGQPSFAQVVAPTVPTIEERLRGRQDRSPNAAPQTGFSGGSLDSLAVDEIQLQPLRVFAFEFRAEHSSIPLRTQLLEQRSSVLQVGCVEAFGEPVVDFGEHLAAPSGTEIPGIFEVASVADGVNDEPHSPQNLALGAFPKPHFVQLSSSCDPHLLQNVSPSGFSDVHRWQRMQSP